MSAFGLRVVENSPDPLTLTRRESRGNHRTPPTRRTSFEVARLRRSDPVESGRNRSATGSVPPHRTRRGYVFPRCVDDVPTLDRRHEKGPLRFPTDLSASVPLNHPGKPRRCVHSLLHGRHRASPDLDRRATLSLRNGAESGSLALQLKPSLDGRIAPHAARSAIWRTSKLHVQFLSTK